MPCPAPCLQALPLDRRLKRIYLLSVAQFRPEKDHAMQVASSTGGCSTVGLGLQHRRVPRRGVVGGAWPANRLGGLEGWCTHGSRERRSSGQHSGVE